MLFEESFRLLSYKCLLIAPVEKEALPFTSYAPSKGTKLLETDKHRRLSSCQ